MSDQHSVALEDHTYAQVILVIPCLAEYVGVARLAILGVANRIAFTYDEVEDVRLAVGEACTHAIDRAALYHSAGAETPPDETSLKIVCTIEKSTLTVEVTDTIPAGDVIGDDAATGLDGIDYQKLGTVLMEILVDHVSFFSNASGTTVRLVKTASQAN